jgi:ATP-dependent Clp protease ATP-binding subunit ClpA
VNPEDLQKAIDQTRGGARITDQNAEANYQALSKYARDLTDAARRGKLDPVIGRDDEYGARFRSFRDAPRTTPCLSASQASERQR